MHYFQFNIGDYRASTAHLSNEEDLAYRRLLDMYYDTENKIPLDTEWVARRIRVDEKTLTVVLKDMFVKEDDGWSHPRCDEVIKQYHAMAEKNRANGRLGGRKKNPVGSQVATDSLPIAKATNNYKPITNKRKSSDVTLDQWLSSLNGEPPIPKDSPVLKFAESAGIPFEFIKIAWVHFKQTMIAKAKTQKDWRQTFNLYIQKDYLKLWAFNQQGECYLTTAGKQALNAMEAA